jgi:LmbE family N-acetylglucosaminyl deacetylase
MLLRQNRAVAREKFPRRRPVSTGDRLLIISPHCDDETLGAGGVTSMARRKNIPVHVAFVTNGDGSRSTQIGEDVKKLRHNTFLELAKMRQKEVIAALHELGVGPEEITFFGYPDGGTQAMWQRHWSPDLPYQSKCTRFSASPYENSFTPDAPYCGAKLLDDTVRLIKQWRPTVVMTTHPADTHADHWAAYSATLAALEILRHDVSTRDWALKIKFTTFLIHRGIWPVPHGYHPEARLVPPADILHTGTRWSEIELDDKARAAKKSALSKYVSQLTFTPHYLRSFLRSTELFGEVPLSEISLSDVSTHNEWVSLARSPEQKFRLHRVWPAADVADLWACVDDKTLCLRIDLPHTHNDKPFAPRLKYRILLHLLNGEKTDAWRIMLKAREINSQEREPFEATAKAMAQNQSYKVMAQRVPGALELEIPLEELNVEQSATLLVSASTYIGRSRLDQTATGAVRLLAPVKQSQNNQGQNGVAVVGKLQHTSV